MAAILEITPRIVAFGSHLVQLHQVTSVQLASVSPWRGFGRLLIAVGGMILVAVLAVPRAPSGTLANGLELTGSGIPSVVGLLLLGLGLIAYFFSRDFLVIATADGEKLRISSYDTRFMMDVVDAMRAAMAAPTGDVHLHYVVNVVERTIERRGAGFPKPDAEASSPAETPRAGTSADGDTVAGPAPSAEPKPSTDRAPLNGARSPTAPDTQPLAVSQEGPGGAAAGHVRHGPFAAAVARSEAAKAGASEAPAAKAQASPITAAERRQPGTTTPSATAAIGKDAHDIAALGQRSDASPGADATRRVTSDDIDRITGLLRAGDAPHLEQLIQLLDVVKRHATGQPPRWPEARQGWTAFSEYARRYLVGDIAGLDAEVDRIDAVLLAEPAVAAQ